MGSEPGWSRNLELVVEELVALIGVLGQETGALGERLLIGAGMMLSSLHGARLVRLGQTGLRLGAQVR